jgi:hypothetical protein
MLPLDDKTAEIKDVKTEEPRHDIAKKMRRFAVKRLSTDSQLGHL